MKSTGSNPARHRSCGGPWDASTWTAWLVLALSACSEPQDADTWHVVLEDFEHAALLSVWVDDDGTAIAVGSNGSEGVVLTYDGDAWQQRNIREGGLWWVSMAPDGTRWIVGDNGTIISTSRDGDEQTEQAPEPVRLYGVIGFAANEAWAVGGDEQDNRGVVWRFDGTSWSMPEDLDAMLLDGFVCFKVWGTSQDDLWIVGVGGRMLHRSSSGWENILVPSGRPLFTVHGISGGPIVGVGGFQTGLVVELHDAMLTDVTPAGALQQNGVHVIDATRAIAVGNMGTVWWRSSEGWAPDERAPVLPRDYHGAFVDAQGGVWTVGGSLQGDTPSHGVLSYFGSAPPSPALSE